MADDDNDNMVLRSIYLPQNMDRHLRAIAFTFDVSKGEMMRHLLGLGLSAFAAGGGRSLAETLGGGTDLEPKTVPETGDPGKGQVVLTGTPPAGYSEEERLRFEQEIREMQARVNALLKGRAPRFGFRDKPRNASPVAGRDDA